MALTEITSGAGAAGAPLHDRLRQCLRGCLSRINSEVVLGRACVRCGVQAPDLQLSHMPVFLEALEPTLGLYLNLSEARALLADLRRVFEQLGGGARSRVPRGDRQSPERALGVGRTTTGAASSSAELPRARAAWARADRQPTPAPMPAWTKRAGSSFGMAAVAAPAAEPRETSVTIRAEEDVERARTAALQLAKDAGMSHVDSVKAATVVSELARNICMYAGEGEVRLRVVASPRPGLEIRAADRGPGIEDVDHVLSGSYRSRTGLGLGLRGSKQLVDRFEVTSSPALGTTVTALKYR